MASLFQVLTSIDFTTVFDEPELTALGEGRLSISIHLKSQPVTSTITGLLAPKFSCDLFDCVLTPHNPTQSSTINVGPSNAVVPTNDNEPEEEEDNAEPAAHTLVNGMRGLGWMTVHNTGEIKYKFR